MTVNSKILLRYQTLIVNLAIELADLKAKTKADFLFSLLPFRCQKIRPEALFTPH